MKNSTFVRWVMAFAFTIMSCVPSFACCKDFISPEATPNLATTVSAEDACLKGCADCDCSKDKCGVECDKGAKVIEVIEKITMSISGDCCKEQLNEESCTVGVDREICRIIYVPPSGPVRQCFRTHEDVKGTPSADGKCCQVVVDNRQYCVQKGGSIFIPGLLPSDKGFTANSITVLTRRVNDNNVTVDGKPQVSVLKLILASPSGCCSASAGHNQGDECTVEVTRQQCTWVGGGPGQAPQRICWTTREQHKGKWDGNCCSVVVDGRKACVQEGGGIFIPGILEGETVQPTQGSKSLINKVLTSPLNALKAIFRSFKR